MMTNTATFPQRMVDETIGFSSVPHVLNDIWTAVVGQPEPAAPVKELGDSAWVAQVRAGDEDAARALVRRLYPTVMKLIRCRLPRRATDEDLAQTVFAKIFSKLHQFSGSVPLEHWVSRIVVNTCFNQFRHEMVRPELRMSDLSVEEELMVQQLVSTEAELPGSCRNAAREVVEKLLDRLTPDERLVITLLHLEEKSVKDICRITGWSTPTVKVRAFRARQKMRRLWKTLLAGARD
jgi:RNA polymerase sigma-70 factor, ECF subfamily